MATIKTYTDIEQSKKLAEILPIESADMHYSLDIDFMKHENTPTVTEEDDHFELFQSDIPCWSLSALFDALPKYIGDYNKCLYYDVGRYYCGMFTIDETNADNPIDACYEMIIKLNEKELL